LENNKHITYRRSLIFEPELCRRCTNERERGAKHIKRRANRLYTPAHIDGALNLFAVSAYTRGYRKSFINSTLYLTLLWRQSFALIFSGFYNRNA